MFVAIDGILYHQRKADSALQLSVPVLFQHALLVSRNSAPTTGHLGINKTTGAVAVYNYWGAL